MPGTLRAGQPGGSPDGASADYVGGRSRGWRRSRPGRFPRARACPPSAAPEQRLHDAARDVLAPPPYCSRRCFSGALREVERRIVSEPPRSGTAPNVSRASWSRNSTTRSAPTNLSARPASQKTRASPVICRVSPRSKSKNSSPALGLAAMFPRVLNMVLPE